MSEIVLVRHAESEANVAHTWQGRGNAPLSPQGQTQVERLRSRINGRRFDAVVCSPLDRTRATAAALSDAPRPDERAIEIDLGVWEDQLFTAVMETDGRRLRAVFAGSDEPFGGTGERLSEVAARIWDLIDEVAEEIGPDGKAAIVTHGGVVDAVMSSYLRPVTHRAHRIVSNTALTHLEGQPGSWQLSRFNDSTHLHPVGWLTRQQIDAGHPVLALIRHGRTRANFEGRIQGQMCWGLDDVGEKQARQLASWYGTFETVYASPLPRAASTASAIAAEQPVLVDGLKEIAMGAWEGMARSDVERRWPDMVRRVFEEGEDLPHGVHGETWQEVSGRMRTTLTSLDVTPGAVTGIVSHGGAIRAYLGSLTGGDPVRPTFGTPENTSVTHVAITPDGPLLCDYAVAPHLEEETQ